MKKIMLLLAVVMTVAFFSGCELLPGKDPIPRTEPSETPVVTTAPTPTPEPEIKVSDAEFEKVKSMAQNASGKVRIAKQEVLKGATGSMLKMEADAFVITLENTGSKKVTEVEIYAVAYDGADWCQVSGFISSIGSNDIQTFKSKDFTIAPGATEDIAIKCDSEKFKGVVAIMASYTTSDGVKHENEYLKEWTKEVLRAAGN